MCLSTEIIENNKNEFISLINSVKRESFDKDRLIKKLNNSDFFIAPATTKYFGSYEGGLCEHCLKVYRNMMSISENSGLVFDSDSIIIVALFHDFYKMGYYKNCFQNKKVYSDSGSKKDENGYFDWVSVKSYCVAEPEERFIYGSGGETSEFMIRQFTDLTLDESVAIINANTKNSDMNLEAFNSYPLLTLLHASDLLACYLNNNE